MSKKCRWCSRYIEFQLSAGRFIPIDKKTGEHHACYRGRRSPLEQRPRVQADLFEERKDIND